MADNIQEEPLDDPKSNQSENQPKEVIPAKETEAIATNQETETMEVHHHAHHDGCELTKLRAEGSNLVETTLFPSPPQAECSRTYFVDRGKSKIAIRR